MNSDAAATGSSDDGVVDATAPITRGEWELHDALRHRQPLTAIQSILRDDPLAVRRPDGDGWLPLHLAALFDNPVEVVQLLIHKYPEALHARTRRSTTNMGGGRLLPLHVAAQHSHIDIVQLLAVAGGITTIRARTSMMRVGKWWWIGPLTPADVARLHHRSDVAEFLDDAAATATTMTTTSPTTTARQYQQSLQHASQDGYHQDQASRCCCRVGEGLVLHELLRRHPSIPLWVVRMVLWIDPNSISRKDANNWVPLHVAVRYNVPVDVVQWLIQQYPASLRAKEGYGWLPAHMAAKYANSRVMQLLVNAYPAALLEKGPDGWIPTHVACAFAQLDVVQVLVNACPSSLQVPTVAGWLPLHVAVKLNQMEVVEWVLDMYPAALQQRTRNGLLLPLHIAARYASIQVVQLLLDKYPQSVSERTRKGWLPISVALQFNRLDVAQLLQGSAVPVEAAPGAAELTRSSATSAALDENENDDE